MANIDHLICTWSGFSGAPGYTSLYFSSSQGPSMQPKVVTFFQTVASYIPSGVTISVPTTGMTLDETNGQQVNTWSGGAVGSIPGTGSNWGPLVAGACVRLETGQFSRSRRVRGRIFLVPLYGNAYATGGALFPTVANAIKAAADALNSTGGQLVVWQRPLMDHSVKPPVQKAPGKSFSVVSTVCPTKAAYLSSRRD